MPKNFEGHYELDCLYLGVDIGGTKILIVIGNRSGKVYGEKQIPTPVKASPDQVVSLIIDAAFEILSSANLIISNVQAIGIGVAGAIDHSNGKVIRSPHLPEWANVNLKELIENQLQIPTIVDNDANAAALAEFRLSNYNVSPSLLFITISTGIGVGLIIHGNVYRGRLGFAGEAGHMPISWFKSKNEAVWPCTLESLASGTGLVSQMKRKMSRESLPSGLDNGELDTSILNTEDLFTLSSKGNQVARSVIKDGIRALGLGLTSLVNILDPGVLVIGGGLTNQWEGYIQPALTIMRQRAFAEIGKELLVTTPQLSPRSGAIGGILLASEVSIA